MAGKWESDAVQKLGEQYKELAAAGAPGDVLNNLHQRAEALRAKEGYSGGDDGSQVIEISSGSKNKANREQSRVTVIGSEDDFNSSNYDFKPNTDYSLGNSGGSLNIDTIVGYGVTALVLIVVLDKLLG